MKIAIAQVAPKISRDNVTLHLRFIKDAIKANADVVVFPELSMSGYMMMDKLYEDAFSLDEFSDIEALSRDIDIVFGAPTREEHKIYNSALYFSQGTLTHVHHKNYLPNYGMFEESRFFFKGDTLELFDTPHGKAMMVVCEDLWSGEMIEKIADAKPDIVYVLAASPARDFKDDTLLIEDKWHSVLKTTALLSGTHVVFSNRIGFEDGVGFWGGSCLVKPNTYIDAKAPCFEEALLLVELDKDISKIEKYMKRY